MVTMGRRRILWEGGVAPRIARGLFRLWLVASAIFVIGTAIVGYDDFSSKRDAVWPGERLVARLCGDTRGLAGTDYTTNLDQDPGPWDLYATPNPFDNCWYRISAFRRLFPEFAALSDDELASKLYSDVGIPVRSQASMWPTLGKRLSIAIGVPWSVLIFGGALVWAFRDFHA
jgi:hypothetical protein